MGGTPSMSLSNCLIQFIAVLPTSYKQNSYCQNITRRKLNDNYCQLNNGIILLFIIMLFKKPDVTTLLSGGCS